MLASYGTHSVHGAVCVCTRTTCARIEFAAVVPISMRGKRFHRNSPIRCAYTSLEKGLAQMLAFANAQIIRTSFACAHTHTHTRQMQNFSHTHTQRGHTHTHACVPQPHSTPHSSPLSAGARTSAKYFLMRKCMQINLTEPRCRASDSVVYAVKTLFFLVGSQRDGGLMCGFGGRYRGEEGY